MARKPEPKLKDATLQKLCDIIGDTATGLTGRGDVLVVEDAEKSGEVGHDARRAARPARCSSSANR